MKKLLLSLFASIAICTINAQDKFGNYGFDHPSKFGLVIGYANAYDKSTHLITPQIIIRNVIIDATIRYKKNDNYVSAHGNYPAYTWTHKSHDYSLNLGYKINLDKYLSEYTSLFKYINIYPLLGVSFYRDDQGSHKYDEWKFNYGGGINVRIYRNIFLNARVSKHSYGAGLGFYI